MTFFFVYIRQHHCLYFIWASSKTEPLSNRCPAIEETTRWGGVPRFVSASSPRQEKGLRGRRKQLLRTAKAAAASSSAISGVRKRSAAGSLRPQPHVERGPGAVAVSYMDKRGPLRNEFGVQQKSLGLVDGLPPGGHGGILEYRPTLL